MASHKIIDTTQEHLEFIAKNIRKPDLDELWATCMQRPIDVLVSGLEDSSAVKTGIIDDEPVCVWGVVEQSLLFNTGKPWMVASKNLDDAPLTFLRHCKPEVMKLLDNYDTLENYVDVRNTKSVQWLRWLGFTIDEPVNYGIFNLPFHKFWMERKNV